MSLKLKYLLEFKLNWKCKKRRNKNVLIKKTTDDDQINKEKKNRKIK